MSDRAWRELIKRVSEEGHYRFTLNQLYIEWQKPLAYKVKGAQLRALLSGVGLWLALFPPASPSPLVHLAPSLKEHLTARGSLWTLLVSALILVTPWRLITRPLPAQLSAARSPKLSAQLSSLWLWLRAPLWRLTLAFTWVAPLTLTFTSLLWWAARGGSSDAWPLAWAPPSVAFVPPLLLGALSVIDTQLLTARSGRGRFMHHFNEWRAVYPIPELLTRPHMQLPQRALSGGLYQESTRKLLLVDQDLTVDLLATNGLHDREELLLLSLQRYPAPAAKFARRLLALYPNEVEVYVLHHEGRAPEQLQEQLTAVGVTAKHKVVDISWREADLNKLYQHLGFKPLDWEIFAVDSLSPRSLLEGVAASLALGVPLTERLGAGGALFPAPPEEERVEERAPQRRGSLEPAPLLGVAEEPSHEQRPSGGALEVREKGAQS